MDDDMKVFLFGGVIGFMMGFLFGACYGVWTSEDTMIHKYESIITDSPDGVAAIRSKVLAQRKINELGH